MEFEAWFQCINGCSGRYPLNQIIYRCPDCNNLLEVTHDMEKLKKRSAREWNDIFDERYRKNSGLTAVQSGAKRSWCAPQ